MGSRLYKYDIFAGKSAMLLTIISRNVKHKNVSRICKNGKLLVNL